MKVSARITSVQRQIKAIQDRTLSPAARSRMLADRAEEAIREAEAQNRAVLGQPVGYTVTVDGKEGASLSSVKPDGRIVANFDLGHDVLEWIGAELVRSSPVLTGRYARSHVMEIDGSVWDGIGPMPEGRVFKFYNLQPYARKIEPGRSGALARGPKTRGTRRTQAGQSDQAPDGVYQAIAAVARERFGDVARVTYTLKNFLPSTGLSHPAITVRML